MATYDIPTNNGVKTVQADSKALALDSLKSAGETPQLLTPTGTNTAPVMTPQNLSSGSLIPVPTTPTSTTATDITAGADASVSNHDALTQKLEADQLAAQTADKKAQGDYQATVNKILGIENSRTSVENGLQVNEKSIVANDAFNALQASKRAQEVAIKNLEANNQGLSDVGLQQETNRINRQYAFEQADLSIALDVANRSYTSAQATADKKIQLQLEPLQTLIGFQEKVLTRADANLSDAEKNKLQVLIDKNKRELDLQQQRAQDLETTNLTLLKSASEQGAPASVIQAITAAKTAEEKIAVAGQYAGDILDRRIKQATLDKANAEINKINREVNDSGDTVAGLAQQLISGNLAPSDLSKRATGTSSYNDVLTAADKLSMAQTGKHFNIAQANIDYKFAQQPNTQNTLKYLGSLVGGVGQTGNLDELVNLSNSIDRTSFPKLNDVEQWARLNAGDPSIAAYNATITEVADQIAKILQGGGSGSGTSDAKLRQANALFQSSFTKGQVIATVNAIKPLLQNRAKSLVGTNPYLSNYAELFGTNLPDSTDLLNKPVPGGVPGIGVYSPSAWGNAPTP